VNKNLLKRKCPYKENMKIRLILCIKFNILISGVYFVQLRMLQMYIIKAVWMCSGNTTVLLWKKDIMDHLKTQSTVICCQHRYTSLFTSLMFSTSRISLCSLQCSLSHNTATKSSKLCLKFRSCCKSPQ